MAYACQPDAEAAATRLRANHGLTVVDLLIHVERHSGPFVRPRGRPPKHAPTPAPEAPHHFRLTIVAKDIDDHTLEQRLIDDATIVLIRTANDGWNITDTDMIARYKGQWHNEHGFAWLTSGMRLNPVFLKTQHRIGALCFLYAIGLMVNNLIQRTVRKNLIANHTGLPYHRRKLSNHITTLFYLDLFAQVQVIPVTMPDGATNQVLAGYTDTIANACAALGTSPEVFTPVQPARCGN